MSLTDPTWVVGAGGLLGQAVVRSVPRAFTGQPIPWTQTDHAAEVLRETARVYAARCSASWTVIWAAGEAVVGTDAEAAAAELSQFRFAIRAMREFLPAGRGVFFLSSSAGGLYAGSSGAPFDEDTPPTPLGAYGRLKLDMERAATDGFREHSTVAIGRFSNLYGPGQDLDKAQGLISQLCFHTLTRTAVSVYVPLETIRDYLFVDDAAALVLAAITAARESGGLGTHIRVLASGESATLAQIIGLISRQRRQRPLISFGVHPNSALQVRDLRFRTLYPAEQRGCVRTQLSVGLAHVMSELERVQRDGGLAH